MSKSTRVLMGVIAVITAMAMALVGCQSSGGTAATSAAAASASASAEASVAATASEAASAPAPAKLDPYQIDYFMLCNGSYEKMPDIDAAMSKIMTEKFNATLKTTMIGWSDWASKVTTRLAAGDKMDVVFTADWYGYSRDVVAGLFNPLNDLLAKDAPDTVASLGDMFIKGSQIDGQNYGVPTNKELLVPGGFIFVKSLVDKYGFDISKVKTDADLEPMLAKIKASEPDVIPYCFDGSAYELDCYPPAADFSDAVIAEATGNTKVEWRYSFAPYVEHLNTMRKWYQAGYIHPDSALDTFKAGDRYQAEGWFCCPMPLKGNNIKSDEMGAASRDGKLKLVEVTTQPLFTHSGDCGGSMLAIPVTSKDPDRAMMFINLIHTDKEAVNLLAWGIDGINYKKVGDNTVQVIKDNGYNNQVLLWTLGDIGLQYVADTENPKKAQLLLDYAKEGKPGPLLGFRFNPDKITNEKTAYDNVAAKYAKPLNCGATDPATELPKFKAEAEAAGLAKCMAEVQAQIDAFLAKK